MKTCQLVYYIGLLWTQYFSCFTRFALWHKSLQHSVRVQRTWGSPLLHCVGNVLSSHTHTKFPMFRVADVIYWAAYWFRFCIAIFPSMTVCFSERRGGGRIGRLTTRVRVITPSWTNWSDLPLKPILAGRNQEFDMKPFYLNRITCCIL
jgi:hypothetical protein